MATPWPALLMMIKTVKHGGLRIRTSVQVSDSAYLWAFFGHDHHMPGRGRGLHIKQV
jgi:hypothetical protein